MTFVFNNLDMNLYAKSDVYSFVVSDGSSLLHLSSLLLPHISAMTIAASTRSQTEHRNSITAFNVNARVKKNSIKPLSFCPGFSRLYAKR